VTSTGTWPGRSGYAKSVLRSRCEARPTFGPRASTAHIHAVGICDPDAPDGPFTTAGPHYTAGATTSHAHHAGDMPSLLATRGGFAFTDFATDRFRVRDLRDADGSAIIVHEGRDNVANIPPRYLSNLPGTVNRGPDATTLATGDSGNRAACGVIEPRAGS
jgi:Cu-Zn family superoxide dismutase